MGKLDVQHLRKVFHDNSGDIVAVDDFDVEIEDGEFIVLVGPSGCGKSTTLRCIAGLETPTSGELVLDGEAVTDKKPKARNMAMVFQNYALYPHMTAEENMSFGLKMTTDLSKDEIRKQVHEAARMMGIDDLLGKKPGELSGGQQQRVALGRAIVREPEVFLMDEPLSNLDAKLRTTMRTELQKIQQEFDVTTIYVTHDQTEAMTMSDRIAVLNDGELQQIGTPLECYHQPENQFVAGFIGSPSMNFFDVELNTSGEAPTLVHDAFSYELDDDVYADIESSGQQFTLGIRPEDIKAVPSGTHNALSPEVEVTEPLGDVTYVYLQIGGKQYTATLEGDIVIESGRKLTVQFPQDRIHLFDGKTGETLRNREPPESSDIDALVGLDNVGSVEVGAE
ncbi:sugar ABC transporter ATP-binding protein [Haloferax sp. Atlit-47N]|uniref:ABC transporter ATP-binding protein n=1 Tax=unclassified Haloferax TaxID=2625095 RepID=UPI000E281B30|nr:MULTISPECIES: ABC transporter ATP-binding protein [unclassified Haloferax]RDZ35640.1 sugar ABC transporter ATP-binding protein [Haloferax sp. Atlit-47N]RDZ39447.1 sugar ABC transporter ATP-binding protein [Haloferax sp. Atlit-19N]RDZ50157.1 sugar ABC transporter ATP-binding protein [Haloferax sp. Atlit-4N]